MKSHPTIAKLSNRSNWLRATLLLYESFQVESIDAPILRLRSHEDLVDFRMSEGSESIARVEDQETFICIAFHEPSLVWKTCMHLVDVVASMYLEKR